MAALYDHAEMLQLLIKHGADLEARYLDHNATALHTACAQGSAKAAFELLKHGSKVNAKCKVSE